MHWESGRQSLGGFQRFGTIPVSLEPGSPPEDPCEVWDICYCNIERCEGSNGSFLGYLNVTSNPGPRRAREVHIPSGFILQDGHLRALSDQAWDPSQAQVRPDEQADVVIVFGVDVVGTNPMLGKAAELPFRYNANFALENPWAQRLSLSMCSEFPSHLRVVRPVCWLVGFKNAWINEGHDWPLKPEIHDIHDEAWSYANSHMTDKKMTTVFAWFDPDRRVRGFYSQAYIDVPRSVGSTEALIHLSNWNNHMEAWNSNAAKQAKGTAQGVWHCSSVWVRAEAEKVILDSTVVTLMISLGCVFLGVMVFTRSIHLALIVMLVVFFVIICLLFFMVVIMQWRIGAIEVLSLIVFVGFAVDYCLHISHKYHSCHITGVEEQGADDDELSPHGEQGSVMRSVSGDASKRIVVTIGDRPSPSNDGPRRPSKCISTMSSGVKKQLFTLPDGSACTPDELTKQLSSSTSHSSGHIDQECRWNEVFVGAGVIILATTVAWQCQSGGSKSWWAPVGELFFLVAFLGGRGVVYLHNRTREHSPAPAEKGPLDIRGKRYPHSPTGATIMSFFSGGTQPSSGSNEGPGSGRSTLDRSRERYERARYALERMGGAVIGSALTTMGCACFLLPCTLHIFFKIGAVVCGVSLYATIYSLFFLPTLLMIAGPCGHDFKGCMQYVKKLIPDDDDSLDESEQQDCESEPANVRRYVLNLPRRGMAEAASMQPAQPQQPSDVLPDKNRSFTRTKVVCNG